MYNLKDYAFVTEKNGIQYYRSIINPKDEICVNGDEVKQVIIKNEI